jgi:hypothetical protein
MGIDMFPPGVHMIAGDVDQAAENAVHGIDVFLESSNIAARKHAPWESSTPLAGCIGSWSDHLHELARRTGQAADNLRDSARDYADVEARITDSLRAIERSAP